MKTHDLPRSIALSAAILFIIPTVLVGQIQHNGTVPLAPQPAGMPPADPGAPFSVTAVTYAALPPNDHYSARLTSIAGGKAFGYLEMGIGLIYDPASQTLDISNQFSPTGSAAGLQVRGTDGPDQTGIYNDGTHGVRCFVQTPAAFLPDARATSGAITISETLFAFDFASACAAVDHGVAAGTAYNELFTQIPVHEGTLNGLSGYSQTAFAGNVTLGSPGGPGGFLTGCCSRARAIGGDQVVGDTAAGGGLPLASDPLGLDSTPAANPNSVATMWLLSAPTQPIQLAPVPSVALATNGNQQGGWAASHAVIWSGSNGSMVDLNPAGYFDSRVTGLSAEFQVGDGWSGGPAGSPGAVQHALLWKGSADTVVDLNQFLPSSILGASIHGVDADGNIVGSMLISTGQEFGLYFKPNSSMALSSFVVDHGNPAPGDIVTGTVALQAPAGPAGVLVSFTTDNGSLVSAPAPLMILQGQSSASFSIPVSANYFLSGSASVTLTAHAGFTAKSATLGVTTRVPADGLTFFTLSSSTAAPGDVVNVQVALAAPAPAGGVVVNFFSSNPGVAPSPVSTFISAGSVSATTSIGTNSTPLFQPVSVLLQAETGNVILPATLVVASPSRPNNVGLGNSLNPSTSAQGNTTGSGFIGFSALATTPGIVTLSSSNPALLVPSSVSFSAGGASAGFNYTALPVASLTTGILSATSNGVTATANISITPSASPSIQSFAIPLAFPTRTFSSGQSLTGTITLSGPAFLGGMTVALSSDTPAAVQIPASVVIPSNATSATFPVTALPVAGPATVAIVATLPGFAPVSVTLTVLPGPALAITSFALSPYSNIGPGVAINGAITLNQPAPAGGVTVVLSASNTASAKLPSSVSIPAGQNSATIAVQGNGVNAALGLTLTASYTGPLAPLGTSASAGLTVSPADALKAAKPTWSSSTHLLTATCTSTNAHTTIVVSNAAGNVPLGTMTNQGNGNYSFQTTISSISSINFKSSLGGATGQGVTVVP